MALDTGTREALERALTALLGSIEDDVAKTELSMDKLTTVNLSGTGVFDKLMRTATLHIQAEFDADRIRGTDYATVYLGMMQACLQTATAFLIEWEKVTLEKANLLTSILANLNQADFVEAQKLLTEAQSLETAAKTLATEAKTENTVKERDLIDSQVALYNQKVITELAEVCTQLPAVTPGSSMRTVVPYAPTKVLGSKGASRDVNLEQRAGYQRKAQNDLIQMATGHVDMLVSSGSATNVGQYTADLLKLLQTGGATPSFPATSLLTKAVTDVAALKPNEIDSAD